MKPYTFLRQFSASSAVAPLPISTAFDQQLKPLLNALLLPTSDQSAVTSSAWFLDALQASINTQTIAFDSLKNIEFGQSDRAAIESYLEENVEALDACNLLSAKMEIIQDYIKSLRIITHLLQNNSDPNPTILARVLSLLESSSMAMNRRLAETLNINSRSSLKRSASSKKLVDCSEYGEILTRSLDIASTVCRMLEPSLQIKPHRLTSWSISLHKQFKGRKSGNSKPSSMMLTELQQTVKVARDLQNHIRIRLKKTEVGDQLKVVVGELESKCDHLKENIMELDVRVRDLYKHLVYVRMSLLETLSRA